VNRPLPSPNPGPRRAAAGIAIRRVQLANFRSYRRLDIRTGRGPLVLIGPNGAGKTNFLEAISFLSPGRGLRRATLEEAARSEGDGSWAVSAEVEGALGPIQLGTGIDPPAEGALPLRRFRIDQEKAASAAAFADHLRVVWLVPEMDGLFLGPASERRRFLDRLVLAIDAEHGTRVSALERALRSRNRLLEDAAPDPRWLDAVAHALKRIPAARASTGERKALLVGLVLSHARLVAAMHGFQPVMLLDDVSAFLDAERRVALFAVIERIGAQVFMTGVDASAFVALGGGAERFAVSAEGIVPLA